VAAQSAVKTSTLSLTQIFPPLFAEERLPERRHVGVFYTGRRWSIAEVN
jgi:hypothetical protein